MKEKMTSKISNVFVEMIILVLFFSVAAVIIFRIHVITITLNNENSIKNNAIVNSNSIIALYKDGNSVKECLKKTIFPDVEIEQYDNKYVVSVDKDFSKNMDNFLSVICTENKTKKDSGTLESIELKYMYYDTEVYKVEGKRYEEK